MFKTHLCMFNVYVRTFKDITITAQPLLITNGVGFDLISN